MEEVIAYRTIDKLFIKSFDGCILFDKDSYPEYYSDHVWNKYIKYSIKNFYKGEEITIKF